MKFLKLKKLGVLGIISFFSVISFVSGYTNTYNNDYNNDHTYNSYAAGSSALLPISKGGTQANTASQASANILGTNFANYTGILPFTKGGTGANNTWLGQLNIGTIQKQTYVRNSSSKTTYIKVASVNYQTDAAGAGFQMPIIAGMTSYDIRPQMSIIQVSGRSLENHLISLDPECKSGFNFPVYYVDRKNSADTIISRDFYAKNLRWLAQTNVIFYENDPQNETKTPFIQEKLYELPEDAVEILPKCLKTANIT
ncbi:MAG: hypothetical protein LBT91_01645 [Bifidobacteriaceae bacterium]|jgi:hypothetical protein|nr:hypothetical protein [Bifidobacteriaceae bacterium]